MWRWEHQGDGRVLRLFQDDREVLVIDKTRLHITDETGVTRFNSVIGEGDHPTYEDEKLILKLLNSGTTDEFPRGQVNAKNSWRD